ncbi:AAA family ATPase [Chitinophaga pinensis]|uniref:ATPase/kinase involved in NAD metabolism-like protein n=1 Tax=Chitinophaga pinensis (strain ATCC 43595 / DSM 2588 / LMG 13176 / NBRC 15968 / NCIMB 11800 / UQM 2034) TaxID=485918 RepID=A0A979G018_CHIPD|nr:ATP-binding protein [Chitinophaga pinensis]ACU58217.1 ATPase/kinase involved in NAD metabolism-like protein [Chitinophaga pinensis DSM 2588]
MLKVVVIGPESTGKSSLSEQLAAHYQTMWVPEYARQYLETLPRPYEQSDLLSMAKGQLAQEDQLAARANRLLICDTDLHVIKVWSEHKYGNCDPEILQAIRDRRYDLYLLTYIDIPWEEDPQREHPDPAMREYFYNVYRELVMESGVPWVEIRGSFEKRIASAIAAVDKLL